MKCLVDARNEWEMNLDTVEAVERGVNDVLGEKLVDASIGASFVKYVIWKNENSINDGKLKNKKNKEAREITDDIPKA